MGRTCGRRMGQGEASVKQKVGRTRADVLGGTLYSRPAFLKLLEEQEGVKVSLRSLVYWVERVFQPRDAEVVETIWRVMGVGQE